MSEIHPTVRLQSGEANRFSFSPVHCTTNDTWQSWNSARLKKKSLRESHESEFGSKSQCMPGLTSNQFLSRTNKNTHTTHTHTEITSHYLAALLWTCKTATCATVVNLFMAQTSLFIARARYMSHCTALYWHNTFEWYNVSIWFIVCFSFSLHL